MSSQPVPVSRDSEPADAAVDPAYAAALTFDRAGREWLREVRWRRPPYDRRGIAIALLVAILAHLVGLWLVRDWMQLRVAPDDRSDVLRVSLVERVEPVMSPPEPVAEPEPEPVVSPEPARVPPRRVARVARQPAAVARPVTTEPAQTPQVRLYGPDGRLELPKLEAEPAMGPPFEFRTPKLVQSPVMSHDSPLPYTATEFEQYWPPDDETALGAFVRRNTVSKTWRTKDGGQISCTWMLFIGGCGWGYAPPNPEGLKKLRFEVPIKAVKVRQAEQAAEAAKPADGVVPMLNLNLPVPEEKPVEGDGFR